MKRGTPNHWKVKALAKRLKIKHFAAVGLLECLWHATAAFARRGDIGRLPDEAIAEAVYWDGDPARLIEALVECRLIDRDESHRLLVHDWQDHADDTVAKTLKSRGETYASGGVPRTRRNFPVASTEPSGTFRKIPEDSGLPSLALPSLSNTPADAESDPGESGGIQKHPRQPDPIWDTVAAVWFPTLNGTVPTPTAKRIGKVCRELRELGATPDTIRRAEAAHKAAWPNAKRFGPESIVKHWHELQPTANATKRWTWDQCVKAAARGAPTDGSYPPRAVREAADEYQKTGTIPPEPAPC